jgi:hypothetical protein
MEHAFRARLPPELGHMIVDMRNKINQAEKEEAEKEEREFQELINADKLIEFTSADVIVPFNNGNKSLRQINILHDGYYGNIWRHPTSGLNKPDTLRQLHENNMQTFYGTIDGNLLGGNGGAMVNQKVKKCEKKKVVLGKERCIYKVSGSKKDYMKYKGKLVPVTDYVKYMKKKN